MTPRTLLALFTGATLSTLCSFGLAQEAPNAKHQPTLAWSK